MDDIKRILAKQLKRKPNKNLHSPAHALTDEISTAFGERKRFAMYLGVINRVGVEKAREIFHRLKQEKSVDNKGKLFMYLCRKEPEKPQETTPAEPTI